MVIAVFPLGVWRAWSDLRTRKVYGPALLLLTGAVCALAGFVSLAYLPSAASDKFDSRLAVSFVCLAAGISDMALATYLSRVYERQSTRR